MKRITAAVLALWLMLLGAAAEFAPEYRLWAENENACARVELSLTALEGWDARSLALLNGWLSRAEAAVTANTYRLELDGETVLQGTEETEDKGAWEALAAELPALYALFDKTVAPRRVKDTTAIDNALSSPSYDLYTLNGEEMAACLAAWETESARAEQIKESLINNPPVGAQRVKRLFDKDGNGMGVVWNGETAGGKASLTFGRTAGRGGSLALKWPELNVSLSWRVRESDAKTLTLSGSVKRTGRRVQWEGTLKESTAGKLTGKLTVTDTKNGRTETLVLEPDMENGAGTVTFTKKNGKRVLAAGCFTVRLTEEKEPEGAVNALPRALISLMAELSPADRDRLTRLMQDAGALNAPDVPAPEIADW